MNISNKQRNKIFSLIGYIEGRVYALGDKEDGGMLFESVLDLQERLHDVFDNGDATAAMEEPCVNKVEPEVNQVGDMDRQLPPDNHQVTPTSVSAASIAEDSEATPSHDKSRFAAPETPRIVVKTESIVVDSGKNENPSGEPYVAKSRRNYEWHPDDKEKLLAMRAAGKSFREIAAIVLRTPAACNSMHDLELKRRGEKRVSSLAAPEKPAVEVGYDPEDKALAVELPEAPPITSDIRSWVKPFRNTAETPQAEVEDASGEEDSGEEEDASGNTRGDSFVHENGEPYFVCPKSGRMFVKLKASDLPGIRADLLEKTFDQVAQDRRMNSGTIKAFLLANGIDYKQFNRPSGTQGHDYNRGIAKKAGNKSYSGKPCASCGSTLKATSSGACIKCTRARTQVWRDPKIQAQNEHAPETLPETSSEQKAQALRRALPARGYPVKSFEDDAYEGVEEDKPKRSYSSPFSTEPLGERNYRPAVLKEWPQHVNYGADNSYPDAPPYNYTHKGQYVSSLAGGISSAAIAVMGGA